MNITVVLPSSQIKMWVQSLKWFLGYDLTSKQTHNQRLKDYYFISVEECRNISVYNSCYPNARQTELFEWKKNLMKKCCSLGYIGRLLFLRLICKIKHDIHIYVAYSRPNGWTDWADIFCDRQKNSKFFSPTFFHGQHRTLQLVVCKTLQSTFSLNNFLKNQKQW